ncbi:MAG TPA: hypothetical protein DCQ63_11680 [Planktothrix sp. UBA8402]|nr:hypothetical protein [Planktothrix sp. UBA8402]
MNNSALIVTGTQRCGLSLTTATLNSAGAKIEPSIFSAGTISNSWDSEGINFTSFQTEVLRSQGVNPDGWLLQGPINVDQSLVAKAHKLIQVKALNSAWGWQDSRTTLLLKFWAEQIPQAKFILIYRAPWEVLDSLYRHQNLAFQHQPELALQYWLDYNQKILQFYNEHQNRCILGNIQTIFQYLQSYIDLLNQQFDLGLSSPDFSIYNPALLNHQTSLDGYRIRLIDDYFSEVIQLYQELESRSWHPEHQPDFSWKQLMASSNYPVQALKDWLNLRQLETENQTLQAESKEELLEPLKSQLQETETVLEQYQEQLQKTESVLETSQKQYRDQLNQTNSELEKTKTQLYQAQWEAQRYQFQCHELEETKVKLQKIQWDVQRYQSQLHQTQEELEYYELHRQEWEDAQSQLDQVEVRLSQLTTQLQQTQKREERFQIQLHQSLAELEQTQTQLQQDQDKLQETSNQVKQLKRDLKRSTSQLYQVQSEFDLSHSQLQQSESQRSQNQTELTEIQSQFDETKRDLRQKQAQVNQLQTELKRSQSQMYQLQIELAQSQLQIEQIQERQRLEQTLSDDPQKHNEMDYNLLIWDAWNAYRNGKLPQMKTHLQKALKLTTASPSEIILTWLESFSKLSLAQGMELDSHSLTNSDQWTQLVRQMTVKKGVTLTEKSKTQDASKQSSNQSSNQVAVETAATQTKPADAG